MTDYADTDARAYLSGEHPVTADEVGPERATSRGEIPLRSGLERPDPNAKVDPATLLPKGADKPVLEPASAGRRSAPSAFMHSAGISNLHRSVYEARRREASHQIGTPKKVAAEWQKVITACDEADNLVREIPLAMSAATDARNRALAEARVESLIVV